MTTELVSTEPATGAILWRGPVSDVDVEVDLARAAFAEWASRPLAVRVRDEGDGIDPSQVDRLFDLFYRTEDARRQAQGAGIGLYVVRALVESAGGRVWAVNRPTGGAEFGFGLPVFVEADDGPAID